MIAAFMLPVSGFTFSGYAAMTAPTPIDIDVGTVMAGGSGFTFADNVVSITQNGWYTITGTTAKNRIKVQSGLTNVNITLSGIDINVYATVGACAFDMTGATVNLTLIGTNTLESNNKAGLQVPAGATLIINGTGSLTATGNYGSAGIGGGSGSGGNITINSGTVIATGGGSFSAGISGGAGIGGGNNGGNGGNITINGGTVKATGGIGGAGIGGGAGVGVGNTGGTGGNIIIKGGNIQATGGGGTGTSGGGAGIGGGCGSNGIGASGNIIITQNATVKAIGGNSSNNGAGAGIGGGGGGGNPVRTNGFPGGATDSTGNSITIETGTDTSNIYGGMGSTNTSTGGKGSNGAEYVTGTEEL